MMRRILFTKALILGLAFAAVAAAPGNPGKDFERKIIKQFPIAADGQIEVSHRYGKLEVETWSDNQVKFEVTIIADARSQDKAEEIFNRVSIDFSNTSSTVRAVTNIESNKRWKSWMGSDNGKFEINYKIYMPATLKVEVSNKYGDIILPTVENNVNVELKYGNLRMDAVEGDVNLTLEYGKGSMSSAKDFNLNMKYSQLFCGDLGDVASNTKYSTFEMGNVGSLQTNTAYDAYRVASAEQFSNVGKYDDFSFEELHSASMITKYSQLVVGRLTESADLDFKHGGVKIKNVSDGFSHIHVDGNYSGISIGTAAANNFTVDMSGTHTSIQHRDIEVYHDVRNNSTVELKGYRGSRDARSKITLRTSYGSLRIN